MKKLFFALVASIAILGIQSAALADYASTPQPSYPSPSEAPHYGPYPYPYPYPGTPQPVYPPAPAFPVASPTIMCFAQGMVNGALFYGVGLNVYAANQWALYACGMTGQYCQLLGCRY